MYYAMNVASVLLLSTLVTLAGVSSFPRPNRRIVENNRVANQIARNRLRNLLTPSFSRRVKLFCKLGFYLAISKAGKLTGANAGYCQNNENLCIFNLQSYGSSLVRIQNSKTQSYLAINRTGHVFSTKSRTNDTLFNQRLLSSGFSVFWSNVHHGRVSRAGVTRLVNWYLGMKKNGQPKNASKSAITHKSVQFLVM